MNPRGDDRMGRTEGNVFTQLPNGFTKGTSVHTMGPDINSTAELRWQKPYVARYDNHIHCSLLGLVIHCSWRKNSASSNCMVPLYLLCYNCNFLLFYFV